MDEQITRPTMVCDHVNPQRPRIETDIELV